MRAEHGRQAPKRLDLLAVGGLGRALGSRDPQQVELAAETLGRAPRAAHDALRARLGRDEREQALADRLRRDLLGKAILAPARSALARQAVRLHALGHLAQRDLAQRGEVLGPEEVVERRRHALRRVDLARAQPLDQRLRREIDDHDLVGLGEERSRAASRAR